MDDAGRKSSKSSSDDAVAIEVGMMYCTEGKRDMDVGRSGGCEQWCITLRDSCIHTLVASPVATRHRGDTSKLTRLMIARLPLDAKKHQTQKKSASIHQTGHAPLAGELPKVSDQITEQTSYNLGHPRGTGAYALTAGLHMSEKYNSTCLAFRRHNSASGYVVKSGVGYAIVQDEVEMRLSVLQLQARQRTDSK